MKKGGDGAVASTARMVSADIVVKLVGVAVLAFYARYLTKEQLAVIPLYEMLGGMTTLFFGFGIFPTFVRSLPSVLRRDIQEAKSIVFTGCSIVITGAAIFSFGIFLYSREISVALLRSPAYSEIIELLSIGLFLSGLKTTTDYLLWSASRFRNISFVKILQAMLTAVVTVGLLMLYGIKGLILGMVIREAVCAGASLFFLRDILFSGVPCFYPARKLLMESLPFYFESYLLYLKSQGDYWIVSTFLGPASMAIYYIAKRLYDMLLTMFGSLDQVITARLSSKRENKAELEESLTKLFSVITMIIFPLVFFIIGVTPAFISVIAGKGYEGSVLPSIILCMAVIIQFIWAPFGRAVFVVRPPSTRFILSLIEALGLIISLASLAPLFNVTGVALGRLISSALAAMAAFHLLRGVIRIEISGRQIFVSFLSSVFMAACLLGSQLVDARLFMLPIYGVGAVFIFLLLTSLFNSAPFYRALSSILPFAVVDPIKLLCRNTRSPRN